MKIVTLLLAFTLASPALADITVFIDTQMGEDRFRTTTWIKGDKVRSDSGTTTSVIIDTATGDKTTLVHHLKMKIEENTRELAELSKGAAPASADPPAAAKITTTGQMEKVGDYDCEIYRIESMGTEVKVWVTKHYPDQEKLREQMKVLEKMASADAPKQPEIPGISIKTEYEFFGMKCTGKLIRIEDGPVDDAKFAIPADYKTRE